MELGALDVECLHLGIAYLDTLGVAVGVEIAVDLEPGAGACGTDQADDGGQVGERLAAPVLADEREQAMFDLVPFAGPRRQVADADLQVQLACQFLQLDLPQANARPIRAAAVGGDQGLTILGIRPGRRMPVSIADAVQAKFFMEIAENRFDSHSKCPTHG